MAAQRALPEPRGSIPIGVLMAVSQSSLSIRPLITWWCGRGMEEEGEGGEGGRVEGEGRRREGREGEERE